MKKGFTLVELLAVISIIAILLLFIVPKVKGTLNESKKNMELNSVESIVNAASNYYTEHSSDDIDEYNFDGRTNLYSKFKTKGGDPDKAYVYIRKTGDVEVKILYKDVCYIKQFSSKEIDRKEASFCDYESQPNEPIIDNGLVPINFNEDGTVEKIDPDTTSWYNYSEKKWANAVVLKDKFGAVNEDNILAYYVWIPRYEMQSEFSDESEIKINFINNKQITPSSGYIIPPGFKFGTQELSGIWVAKFEPSYLLSENVYGQGYNYECESLECEIANNIRIIPGAVTLKSVEISKAFYTSRSLEKAYGLLGDSHMMKNSEWATVAYLSHSKFGTNKEITKNPSNTTGGGSSNSFVNNRSQSTTDNITGIYDMVGNGNEIVMAGYREGESTMKVTTYWGNTDLPEKKYFDIINGQGNMIGQAFGDTSGWYSDTHINAKATIPYVIRGGKDIDGSGAGIFNYDKTNGQSENTVTFRPVFTPID